MPLGGFAPCPFPLGGSSVDGWTAQQHARCAADMLAMLPVVPFAVVTFSTAGTLTSFLCQPGIGVDQQPTIANISPGVATVQWANGYADEYGNAWPVKISSADVGLLGTAAGKVTYEIVDVRTVRVRTFDNTGAAANASVTLVVY